MIGAIVQRVIGHAGPSFSRRRGASAARYAPVARYLASGALSVCVAATQLSAQTVACPGGNRMFEHRLSPAVSTAGRSYIFVHGFRPLQDTCSEVLAAAPATDYWMADNTGTSGAAWTGLISDLHATGARTWFWRWPTYLGMDAAATALMDWIAFNGAMLGEDIVLVGHSMGGLVALEAVTRSTALNGRTIRVITLGTPHRGTTRFSAAQYILASVDQVQPGSAFLNALAARRQSSVVNNRTFLLGGRAGQDADCEFTLSGDEEGDCVVALESAYDGDVNDESTNGPFRIRSQGGPFALYDHTQIKLDYTNGFPRDGLSGDALRTALRSLLIDQLSVRLTASSTSVSASSRDLVTRSVQISSETPATGVGLIASLVTGSASIFRPRLSQSTASQRSPAALDIEMDGRGLPAGTYSATVEVTSTAPASRRVRVAAVLTVPAGGANAYTITIAGAGVGDGQVTSSDGRLQCRIIGGVVFDGDCQESLAAGERINLTATSLNSSSFVFGGWSGGGCAGTGTCSPIEGASATVTAAFVNRPTVSYSVQVDPHPDNTGAGRVRTNAGVLPVIDCQIDGRSTAGTCAASYPERTDIVFEHAAAPGFEFVRWGGDCAGSDCPIRMTRGRTVEVYFQRATRTISASVAPSGAGTVEGAGAYAQFGEAVLTANAAVGYRFSHWSESGGILSYSNPLHLSAFANRVLVAHFTRLEPVLGLMPPQLQLRMRAGGPLPASLSSEVRNLGVDGTQLGALSLGSTEYSDPSASDWLSAQLTSPAAPSAVVVSVTRSDLPVGSYSAIVPVIGGESDSARQSLVVSLTVDAPPLADLSAVVVGWADILVPGEVTGVTLRIDNRGDAQARAGWRTRVYLSRDDVFEDSDLLVGEQAVERELAAATTSDVPTIISYSVPDSLDVGQYTIFARLDADEQIAEADEQNNLIGVRVAVVAPPRMVLSTRSIEVFVDSGAPVPPLEVVSVTNGGNVMTLVGGLVVDWVAPEDGFAFAPVSATFRASDAPTELTLRLLTTDLAPGTYSTLIAIRSRSALVRDASQVIRFAVTVARPAAALSIATEALPPARVGRAYSAQLRASEATGVSWRVAPGATLPPGLSLSMSGVLAGTPTQAGRGTASIEAVAGARVAARVLSLEVRPVLAIATAALPEAVVGRALTGALQASGAYDPVWSLESGPLPQGVDLSSTGALSGAPTASGAFPVTIRVRDSDGAAADRAFVMTVGDVLRLVTATLPVGIVGVPYRQPLVAAGGTGTYEWTVSPVLEGGAPITGPQATIDLTPSAPLVRSLNVNVRSGTQSVDAVLELRVEEQLALATTTLPTATVGEPYDVTLLTRGGSGAPSFALLDGALPAGLTLAGSGRISGTPAAPDTSEFTLRVATPNQSASAALRLEVLPGTALLRILALGDGDGRVDESTGRIACLVFAGLAGGDCAEPVAAGSTVQLRARPGAVGRFLGWQLDGAAAGADTVLTVTMARAPRTATATFARVFVVSAAAYPSGTGTAVPFSVRGIRGETDSLLATPAPGYRFLRWTDGAAAVAATPQLRVTFDADRTVRAEFWRTPTVTLRADPADGGDVVGGGTLDSAATVTAVARSRAGWGFRGWFEGDRRVSLDSNWTLTVQTDRQLVARFGRRYQVAARAEPVNAGTVAGGGTFTAGDTAVLTVTPAFGQLLRGWTEGTQALGGAGVLRLVVSRDHQLVAMLEPRLAMAALPDSARTVVESGTYSRNLTATGGRAPYAWSGTGLPPGLALQTTGALSGAPTDAGTFTSRVIVASDIQADTQSLVFTILPKPRIAADTLPHGHVGRRYSVRLRATAGTGQYTWRAVGTPPAGLAVRDTGSIEGTPITGVSGDMTLEASSGGVTDRRTLALRIWPALALDESQATPRGTVGLPYSATLRASGGTGTYAWSAVSGLQGSGLTISATGELSGAPSGAGTIAARVRIATPGADTVVDVPIVVVPQATLVQEVVARVLAGDTPSSSDRIALDQIGNRNNRFDIGDLLALLDRNPGLQLEPATLARLIELQATEMQDSGRRQ